MKESSGFNITSLAKVDEQIFADVMCSNKIVEDIKTGDVMLVHQTDISRERWPLGRMLDVFPGKDGHTCVVKVQCGNKPYVRPIHKLVPLNVGQN